MSHRRGRRVFRPHVAALCLMALPHLSDAAASWGNCQSTAPRLYCPSRAETACEGDEFVSDCLSECSGYAHRDAGGGDSCVDRRLFRTTTTESGTSSSSFWIRDAVGLCVWFLAAGVATACGVGGGGVYVPLGILLLSLQPKTSSGLSQASIFGASLGGLLLNGRNRHPRPIAHGSRSEPFSRPLIDYDMALFLAPMEMSGAVLGVLVQTILPNWLYLLLAAIILAVTAHKTFGKYRSTRTKERASEVENGEESPSGGGEDNNQDVTMSADEAGDTKRAPLAASSSKPSSGSSSECDEEVDSRDDPLRADNHNNEVDETAPDSTPDLTATAAVVDPVQDTDADGEECRRLLEVDERQYPREKIMSLILLWIGLVLLTFFKGGKGVDSLLGITCESPWYGVLIAVQFVWTLGFASLFGWRLLRAQAVKTRVGYPLLPEDVVWDLGKLRFYASFTFLAGIVAGLIGIGGGMVLGPLMLVMGIHPQVSSATTATMIVLTSSSVAILYVTAGLVPWDYALAFFGVCLFGAYVGKKYIDGYVKRTGRASLLILLLAIIIGLATVGCVTIALMRLAAAEWCFASFNKFCKVDHEDDGALDSSCAVRREESLAFLQ